MGSGKVLGVTGSIASGKSLVAAMLADLGASVLSADDIAREVVAPGSLVLQQLVAVFGDVIQSPEGSLDRERLGRIVFNDPVKREQLETRIHPAIAAASEAHLQRLKLLAPPLIVYEAPLLFEANAESRVDEVLVVFVSPEIQMDRLCAREKIDRETAEARIAAHWPQHEKLARADYVIDNSGSFAETRQQVKALYDYLVGTSR